MKSKALKLALNPLRWPKSSPKLVVVALVALCLGALVLSRDLPIGLKLTDFYPPQQRLSAADQLLLQRYGGDNRLTIVLQSAKALNRTAANDLIERLALSLNTLPEVATVDYRLDAKLAQVREQELPKLLKYHLNDAQLAALTALLQPVQIQKRLASLATAQLRYQDNLGDYNYRDPLGVQSLVAATARSLSGYGPITLSDNYFADRSKRRRFLLVTASSPLDSFAGNQAFVGAVRKVVEQFAEQAAPQLAAAEAEILISGKAAIVVEGYLTLLKDTEINMILCFLAVFFLAVAYFRRPIFSLLTNLPIVLSLALTLFTSAWLYGEVHLITLVFCALLIGLGDDFSVHLATHFFANADSKSRLSAALRRPRDGILFSAATAVVAFGALITSSYPVIQRTGVTMAIGVVYVLLASYLFTPALLQLCSVTPHSVARFHNVWRRPLALLQKLHQLPRLPSLLFWLALLVVSGMGVGRLKFESHPWSVLTGGNAAAGVTSYLQHELQSSFTPLLVVSRSASEAEALALDRQVYQALLQIKSRAKISSLHSVSPWLVQAGDHQRLAQRLASQPELQPQTFLNHYHSALKRSGLDPKSGGYAYLAQDYPNRIQQALMPSAAPLTSEHLRLLLGDANMQRFVVSPTSADGNWVAITQVYLQRFVWEAGAITPFLREWPKVVANLPGNVTLLAESLRALDHQKTLRRDAVIIGLVMLAAVVILLLLLFGLLQRGGWRWALLVMVPVASGLLILLGAMGWLNIELNFLTLAVLPVVLGIGMDETLHLVARLRHGESMQQILQEVGPAILVVTSSTIAAFLTLTTTRYQGVHEFGLAGAIGVTSMMVVALHLLPLLRRRP